MPSASVSELKSQLSAFLAAVRHGDEVLITDRGRVIARLAPVHGDTADVSRRDELIRAGRLRPATAPLPASFWSAPRPRDDSGESLAALLDERREGW